MGCESMFDGEDSIAVFTIFDVIKRDTTITPNKRQRKNHPSLESLSNSSSSSNSSDDEEPTPVDSIYDEEAMEMWMRFYFFSVRAKMVIPIRGGTKRWQEYPWVCTRSQIKINQWSH